MELLISMKGEQINKAYSPHFSVMYTPTAIGNMYFLAEIREDDPEKLGRIKELIPVLWVELCVSGEFKLETTGIGFIVKKKVDENSDYMEQWERWVRFSRSLYREVARAIGEKLPESFDAEEVL
jgi:hypothetical protein